MNPILITTGLVTYVITNIGISALVASISSITHTSQNIYDILKKFSFSKSKQKKTVYENLVEFDLETTIRVLNAELKDINKEKISSESVNICIESIKKITTDIESELLNIDRMTNYNESLWIMKNIRSYDCEESINKLKKYKSILDNRRKLLNEALQNIYYIKQNFDINTDKNLIIEERKLSNIQLNNNEMTLTENYFAELI